jgi:Uma2 family endonuclease
MSVLPHKPLSLEAYLEQERTSQIKHEFVDGYVFAMSGASHAHILIEGNCIRTLGNQLLSRPCFVYSSNMQVKVNRARYTHPDVMVVCGKSQLANTSPDMLFNPTLIIEILSSSTEAYDRGDKFMAYQGIPDLREYVLIAQDKTVIETWLRQSSGKWLYDVAAGVESSIMLESVACTLNLSEVYAKVNFPPPRSAAGDL